MTATAEAASPERAGIWDRRPVLAAVGITCLGLMLASFANLADPLVRHDDFPALLVDPAGFYMKTLHEGRWLNYWWHLRGVETPGWLNFALYQFFCAVFAGASAVNACGRDARPFYIVTLAMLIAIAPQAMIVSLWFNTLIPGMGLVALYAVLACVLKPALTRALLVVFVPLTLMAYTTYPFMLLGICLTQAGTRRGFGDLARLSVLFIASFALAMVAIYALNYAEHGIFGMKMADWRSPNPATDLASALENLERVWAFMHDSVLVVGFYFKPIAYANVAALVLSLAYLARVRFWEAAYILTGIIAGLSVISLHVVLSGVSVPVRATWFVWIFYVIALIRMAQLAQDRDRKIARITRNFALIILLSYMVQTGKQYLTYASWQRLTASIAAEVGPGDDPVYITGSFRALPEAKAAMIQQPRGLRLRLVYLTGREVIGCGETPAACAALPAEAWATAQGTAIDIRRLPGGGTLVRLPPAPEDS